MLIQTQVQWLEIIEMRQMSRGPRHTELLSVSRHCAPTVSGCLLNLHIVASPKVPAGIALLLVAELPECTNAV